MNKTMLFLIMGMGFFWLALDQVYGKRLLSQFVVAIIPAADETVTTHTSASGQTHGGGGSSF